MHFLRSLWFSVIVSVAFAKLGAMETKQERAKSMEDTAVKGEDTEKTRTTTSNFNRIDTRGSNVRVITVTRTETQTKEVTIARDGARSETNVASISTTKGEKRVLQNNIIRASEDNAREVTRKVKVEEERTRIASSRETKLGRKPVSEISPYDDRVNEQDRPKAEVENVADALFTINGGTDTDGQRRKVQGNMDTHGQLECDGVCAFEGNFRATATSYTAVKDARKMILKDDAELAGDLGIEGTGVLEVEKNVFFRRKARVAGTGKLEIKDGGTLNIGNQGTKRGVDEVEIDSPIKADGPINLDKSLVKLSNNIEGTPKSKGGKAEIRAEEAVIKVRSGSRATKNANNRVEYSIDVRAKHTTIEVGGPDMVEFKGKVDLSYVDQKRRMRRRLGAVPLVQACRGDCGSRIRVDRSSRCEAASGFDNSNCKNKSTCNGDDGFSGTCQKRDPPADLGDSKESIKFDELVNDDDDSPLEIDVTNMKPERLAKIKDSTKPLFIASYQKKTNTRPKVREVARVFLGDGTTHCVAVEVTDSTIKLKGTSSENCKKDRIAVVAYADKPDEFKTDKVWGNVLSKSRDFGERIMTMGPKERPAADKVTVVSRDNYTADQIVHIYGADYDEKIKKGKMKYCPESAGNDFKSNKCYDGSPRDAVLCNRNDKKECAEKRRRMFGGTFEEHMEDLQNIKWKYYDAQKVEELMPQPHPNA